MLTLYLVPAVGAHVCAKDKPVDAIPAVGFLVTYAAMTVQRPLGQGVTAGSVSV